jgi:hypothetical protein
MVHLWSSNCFLPLQNRFWEPPASRIFSKLRPNSFLSQHGQMEQEGTRGNRKEFDDVVCGGVVQLVRTPACHAGGGGFESRRSRHFIPNPERKHRPFTRRKRGFESFRARQFNAITSTDLVKLHLHGADHRFSFYYCCHYCPKLGLQYAWQFCGGMKNCRPLPGRARPDGTAGNKKV